MGDANGLNQKIKQNRAHRANETASGIKSASYFGLIAVIIIIVVVITSIGIGTRFGFGHIKKKWPKYRCKPYIIPIAGIIGPKNKDGKRMSSSENHAHCMSHILNKSSDDKLKSMHERLKHQDNFNHLMSKGMNENRKLTNHMRNSFKHEVQDIQHKVHNVYLRVAYVFRLIEKLAVKIFIVITDLFKLLQYAFFSIASLWNGPVGGLFRAFCFDENTPVNNYPIKYVPIGENIFARFKFSAENIMMYDMPNNINNIIVSGNHLIRQNNKWMPIKNCDNAVLLKYTKPYIYCLGTKNGVINVNGTIFKDFFDESNKIDIEKNFNKGMVVLGQKLNMPQEDKFTFNNYVKDSWFNDIPAFHAMTPITLDDNTQKIICQLKIGDNLKYGGEVLGIVEINGDILKNIYNYSSIICGGSCITKSKKNSLVQVRTITKPQLKSKKTQLDKIFYHVVTSNGFFMSGDILFAVLEPNNSSEH